MIAKKVLFMILIGKDVQMLTSVRARTVFASKNVQILKVYFFKKLLSYQNRACFSAFGKFRFILNYWSGSFYCECKAGYEQSSRNAPCYDIDECDQVADQAACGINSICENTSGSFSCSCKEGRAKIKNAKIVVDLKTKPLCGF